MITFDEAKKSIGKLVKLNSNISWCRFNALNRMQMVWNRESIICIVYDIENGRETQVDGFCETSPSRRMESDVVATATLFTHGVIIRLGIDKRHICMELIS
jgi:hypothetical protein